MLLCYATLATISLYMYQFVEFILVADSFSTKSLLLSCVYMICSAFAFYYLLLSVFQVTVFSKLAKKLQKRQTMCSNMDELGIVRGTVSISVNLVVLPYLCVCVCVCLCNYTRVGAKYIGTYT